MKLGIRYWSLLIVVFIITSVIIYNNIKPFKIYHDVLDNSYGTERVINVEGYDSTNGKYSVINDDTHYVTYYHYPEACESTIVLTSSIKEDEKAYLWFMTNDGKVLNEYSYDIKEGDRFIMIDDVVPGTSLISISIDNEFGIQEIVSTNTIYPCNKKKIVFVLIELLLAIIICIIHKMGFFWAIYNKLKDLIDVLLTNKKQLLIIVSVVLSSIMISFFICFLLNSVGGYSSNYKILLLYFSIIISLFGMIYVFVNKYNNIELVLCLIVFLSGTLYSFTSPTSFGVSWDDQIHYANANKIIQMFEKRKYLSDIRLENQLISVANDKYTFDKASSDNVNEICDYYYNNGYSISYKPIINYQILVHTPISVFLLLARGLGLPFHLIILFGRWSSTIMLSLFSYLSMKKLKNGKIVVFVLSMIPTVSFLAGTYNYDIWVLSWLLLAYSFLFYEYQIKDEKMGLVSEFLIPFSFLMALWVKQVYFVLVIPAFVLGWKKYKSKLQLCRYYIFLVLSMSIPFFTMLFNSVLNVGVGDSRGGSSVNAGEQISFIKNHFSYFLPVLLNFLKFLLNPFKAGDGIVTMMGFGGIYLNLTVVLVAIIVACFLDHEATKDSTFPVWYRIAVVLLYIAVGALVSTSMYVYFTPVGADYLVGVQGRYLLPVLFPTLYVLSRVPLKCYLMNLLGKERLYVAIAAVFLTMNCYSVYMSFIQYY